MNPAVDFSAAPAGAAAVEETEEEANQRRLHELIDDEGPNEYLDDDDELVPPRRPAHEAACLFCLNRGHPAHECPEANVDLIKKAKHDITYGESRDAALYRALFLAARR